MNDRLDNLENDVLNTKENIIKNEISDSEKPNSATEIKIKQNFKEDQTSNVKEIKKDKVIDTKKSNKFFFWNRKKKNTTPVKKNLDSSKYGTTHPDTWDLSEETIERELQELRKRKKNY